MQPDFISVLMAFKHYSTGSFLRMFLCSNKFFSSPFDKDGQLWTVSEKALYILSLYCNPPNLQKDFKEEQQTTTKATAYLIKKILQNLQN